MRLLVSGGGQLLVLVFMLVLDKVIIVFVRGGNSVGKSSVVRRGTVSKSSGAR